MGMTILSGHVMPCKTRKSQLRSLHLDEHQVFYTLITASLALTKNFLKSVMQ